MTRTESSVCWLGWGILALVSMYGCTGSTVRADEIVGPAIEAPNLVIETPDLADSWQSTIGLEYEFTQDGPDFVWRVNGSGQLGMGTVAGSQWGASWRVNGRQVQGRGEIVERIDGKPSRIRWNK